MHVTHVMPSCMRRQKWPRELQGSGRLVHLHEPEVFKVGGEPGPVLVACAFADDERVIDACLCIDCPGGG